MSEEVNKLLKEIVERHYSKDLGTYDYDGIAEDVLNAVNRADPVYNYKRWRADKGSEYRYLSDTGKYLTARDMRDRTDNFRYATGNYFEISKGVDKLNRYLLARQRLSEAANGFKPDWSDLNQRKWYVFYDHWRERWRTDWVDNIQVLGGTIYCPSEEVARRVIDTMQEELGIVRDYRG